MRVVDAIGNEIHKGSTLYWKAKDLFVKVADVIQPEGVEGRKVAGGLMLVMAIPLDNNSKDVQVPEFVCTVDPQSQEVLAKAQVQ
jgi:hypothetical protein